MRMTVASLVLAVFVSGCSQREPVPAGLASRYIGYSVSSLRSKLGEEVTVEPRDGHYVYYWVEPNGAGSGACEIEVDARHNGAIQAVRLMDTPAGSGACQDVFNH